ncbi:hypothetical protein M758_UG304300 [Ceratodon purpureus]|nr:hypothetical protein M758_UG304300 [Ceratodon purpureus]
MVQWEVRVRFGRMDSAVLVVVDWIFCWEDVVVGSVVDGYYGVELYERLVLLLCRSFYPSGLIFSFRGFSFIEAFVSMAFYVVIVCNVMILAVCHFT